MPGDPVTLLIRDPRLPEAIKQQVRVTFGLDKPLYVQFVTYLFNVFQGQLGYSFVYRTPVADLLWSRVQNTIPLVLGGNLLAIGIGVLAGVITAWKRGSRIDSVGQTIVLSLYSVPYFFFGMSTLMVLVLFMGANVPVGGMGISGMAYPNIYDQLADYLRHLAIPMLVYALGASGAYGLIVRNVMVEVLSEDYITTSRAKGLKERTIMFGTALRNASLPLITLVALNLGFVVGGAIEIETVFSWPGIGLLVYHSVLSRDYPVLQGAFLLLTMTVILANLFADILYFHLDPRVRQ
jgi:peptide/nickel transport system permease protein